MKSPKNTSAVKNCEINIGMAIERGDLLRRMETRRLTRKAGLSIGQVVRKFVRTLRLKPLGHEGRLRKSRAN